MVTWQRLYSQRESPLKGNGVDMDKKSKLKKLQAAIRKVKPVHRDKWTISSYDEEKSPRETD